MRPEESKKSVIVGRRFVDSSPSPRGSVFIRNVKLEQGSKPTDYSPAPEDTTVAITAITISDSHPAVINIDIIAVSTTPKRFYKLSLITS